MKDARLGQIASSQLLPPASGICVIGAMSFLTPTAVPAWVGFAAMTGSSRKKTNAGAVPTLRFDCSTVETQTCVIYARAALRELGWEVRKKAA